MGGEIFYREECYQIQAAIFEVYREMGCGFLESVYQECLCYELSKRGISFAAHPKVNLFYKNEPLQQAYVPDFICHDSIIMEIKALANTTGEHQAQVLNYLRATKMRLGLLVNFGCHPKATIERIVL